jgi:hypothetical protein
LLDVNVLWGIIDIRSVENNLPNIKMDSLCCGALVLGFAKGRILHVVGDRVNSFLYDEILVNSLVNGIQ